MLSRRAVKYPMFSALLILGSGVGIALTIALQEPILLPAMIVLFASAGATWRPDMPPIFPFCFFNLGVSILAGLIYLEVVGHYPNGDRAENLHDMVWISLVGLVGLVFGVRLGFRAFSRRIDGLLSRPPTDYDLNKLSRLTMMVFIVAFFLDLAPGKIWADGQQIIRNLLELRYVPYFILLVSAFNTERGLYAVAPATIVVVLPEFLTGFSSFKDVLFVMLLSALTRFRPWVRTLRQAQINLKIAFITAVSAILIIGSGLIWQGSVKSPWRDYLSKSDGHSSQVEKLIGFFSVATSALESFNLNDATESLTGRLSSGALYFSYVIERVPSSVAHEEGALFQRAISNATTPRFLFPNKASQGGDSWLVRQYAGIDAAGDESGASIGLGYMAEFYIDFGTPGVFMLSIFFGFAVSTALAIFAMVSPSREVFIGLSIGLLLNYFTTYDGSFIKIFAGMLQYTMILAVGVRLLGRRTLRWVENHTY